MESPSTTVENETMSIVTITKHAVTPSNRLAAAICKLEGGVESYKYQVLQGNTGPLNYVVYESAGSAEWCKAEVDRFAQDGLLPHERTAGDAA